MPYIITTHRYLEDPTAEFLPDAKPAVTRRAVATLDEARAHIATLPGAHSTHYGRDSALSESGGSVGPLADGIVIEVVQVDWADLPPIAEARKRYPSGKPRDAVIRAYNAHRAELER